MLKAYELDKKDDEYITFHRKSIPKLLVFHRPYFNDFDWLSLSSA